MPDRIIEVLNNLPPQWAGVLLAMFMSVIRTVYDKEETRPVRIMCESLICGGLSLTATAGITSLGLNTSWSVFVGGAIGYFGSATVRAFSLRLLNKKMGYPWNRDEESKRKPPK